MNLFNIENTYRQKIERGWDEVFWCIDVHNTIIPGLYDIAQKFEFYPDAKEVLQFLTRKTDVVMILYTCSHQKETAKMQTFFNANGVTFKYVNTNVDVPSTALGNYEEKPYFNILLEDKAGLEKEDWKAIRKLLEEIYNENIE